MRENFIFKQWRGRNELVTVPNRYSVVFFPDVFICYPRFHVPGRKMVSFSIFLVFTVEWIDLFQNKYNKWCKSSWVINFLISHLIKNGLQISRKLYFVIPGNFCTYIDYGLCLDLQCSMRDCTTWNNSSPPIYTLNPDICKFLFQILDPFFFKSWVTLKLKQIKPLANLSRCDCCSLVLLPTRSKV